MNKHEYVDMVVGNMTVEELAQKALNVMRCVYVVRDEKELLLSLIAAVRKAGAKEAVDEIRKAAYEPSVHWAKDMGYQRGAVVIVPKFALGLNNDGSEMAVPTEVK